MGNVEPKSASRFDDDADFAASFVLGKREVEDALAAAAETPSDTASPLRSPSRNKKLLYGAATVLAVLLVFAILWLGV